MNGPKKTSIIAAASNRHSTRFMARHMSASNERANTRLMITRNAIMNVFASNHLRAEAVRTSVSQSHSNDARSAKLLKMS